MYSEAVLIHWSGYPKKLRGMASPHLEYFRGKLRLDKERPALASSSR